jgi:YVTN family beta-propeller protein
MFITKMGKLMFGEKHFDGLSMWTKSARFGKRPPGVLAIGVAALGVFLLVLSGGSAPGVVWAQLGESSTSLLNATRAIAVNAKTGKVYAVAGPRDGVTVFQPGNKTPLAITVGKYPVALAVNEVTNRIYVANNGGGSVSVIDGLKDTVVATVEVGQLPYVLAVNAATNEVFVSRTFSDVMTVIDGATNATSTVKAGSADSIVVDSKKGRAYLTGWEGTSLTAIDSKGSSVGKIRMGGMHLWGVAVDEAAGRIYAREQGARNWRLWTSRLEL